ncbi:MAG: glycosyltransferase [Bacillota bacterium]
MAVIIYPPTLPWRDAVAHQPQLLLTALARTGIPSVFCEDTVRQSDPAFERLARMLFVCRNPGELTGICDYARATFQPLVLLYSHAPHAVLARTIGADVSVFLYLDESVDEFALMSEPTRIALQQADLVITVSQRMNSRLPVQPHRSIVLRNAVDPDRFTPRSADTVRPPELRPLTGPIVGFHGSLQSWVDQNLVAELARRRPDWNLVIVGPVYVPVHRLRLPNIHLLGARPFEEVPNYVRCFDTGLIPFEVRHMTDSCSPIKMYEYMAAEVPVVATAISECLITPGVRVGRSVDEFEAQVEGALRAPPVHRVQLRKYALENTWLVRAKQLYQQIEVILREKGLG